jgi:polyisoprenoid-binding protein YceI
MRQRFAASALLALLVCAPGPAAAATVFERMDTNHSTIGFTVPILGGLSEVEGKFTDFAVRIVNDEADPARSSVEATIQAASISTGVAPRDNDLRGPNFFDVARFPTITFKSTRVEHRGEQWVAVGDLTMHGVTKTIELPFKLTGPIVHAETKKLQLAARASIHLDRDQFGIAWRHQDPFFVGTDIAVDIRLLTRLTDPGAPSAPAPKS